MHEQELTNDEIEQLLTGIDVPGLTLLSDAVRRTAIAHRGSRPTPVGAALAEFVHVDGTIDIRDRPEELVDLRPDAVNSRRSVGMLWKKLSAGVFIVAAGMALLGSQASAEAELDDGDYSLVLPGIGEFDFTIDSEADGETVIAVAAPEGYTIDDDDPDKAAWKDVASLEVEIKTDKVEGDYDWSGGDADLNLPDGGSISVSPPDADGNFTVTASGGWFAFGSDRDWVVADSPDIETATRFFAVEATEDGIEIKSIDEPGDGFLNDLREEEEEEEAEDDDADEEDDDADDEDEEDEDEEDEEDEDEDDDDEDDDEDNGKARGKDKS